MNKKSKKTLIITGISIVVIILVVWLGLLYYWNTDPEAICNGGGGSWIPLNNDDCSDLCSIDQADRACEDRLRMMGCSCGLSGCWDGKKCVNK